MGKAGIRNVTGPAAPAPPFSPNPSGLGVSVSGVSITAPGRRRERPQTAPGRSGSAAGMVGATPGPPTLEPAAAGAGGTGHGGAWALQEPRAARARSRSALLEPGDTGTARERGPAAHGGSREPKSPTFPRYSSPAASPRAAKEPGQSWGWPSPGQCCRQVTPARTELRVSVTAFPWNFTPGRRGARPR